MFKSKEIQWIYSPKTGSIPYIINNKKDKVKVITDDTIIPFEGSDDKTFYPEAIAQKAVINHYGINENDVKKTDMFSIASNDLNMFEFLVLYRGRPASNADLPFSKTAIKLIKFCHDRKQRKRIKKEEKQELKKAKREKQFNQEREF